MLPYSLLLTCPTGLLGQRRHPLNNPILTVLIFLGDFSTVILFFFFFECGGGIEEDGEIEDAYFFIEDVLVDFVLALIRDGDAEVCMWGGVLRMMLIMS